MSHASRPAAALPAMLYVDPEQPVASLMMALREHFHVMVSSATPDALQQIERTRPAFVVSDLSLPDGGGLVVCRAAKRLEQPASVLVTARQPDLVPDALEAGCDGVLLKPFAPNLFHTRLGRLMRARVAEMRERSARCRAKSAHLLERVEHLKRGTNQQWPNTHCPHCGHQGVTSFEFVSYRRAWYACLTCKKVWIARRLEES